MRRTGMHKRRVRRRSRNEATFIAAHQGVSHVRSKSHQSEIIQRTAKNNEERKKSQNVQHRKELPVHFYGYCVVGSTIKRHGVDLGNKVYGIL